MYFKIYRLIFPANRLSSALLILLSINLGLFSENLSAMTVSYETDAALETAEEQYSVVWYVHLQKNWVPYPVEISQQLENEYNLSTTRSSYFNIKAEIYWIDFKNMIQIHKNNSSKTRKVRRIKYSIPLSATERTAIPLTYKDVVKIGGHTKGRLSLEERLNRRTDGEESSGTRTNEFLEDSFNPKRRQ